MTTTIKADSPQEALRQIRKARLANKNKWLFLTVEIGEAVFHVKTFNLSIQRLEGAGIRHSTGEDLTAKRFDELLIEAFTY
jgi:hypothetical protein